MGVGMPSSLLLDIFGSMVWDAFGHPPYHVGSSLKNKSGWRDVDVRMILADDEWDAMGLGEPERCHQNGKWVSLCLAYSALGKQMTGLPIDFQLQRQTDVNAEYKAADGHPRSALGLLPHRFKQFSVNEASAEERGLPTPTRFPPMPSVKSPGDRADREEHF